MEKRASKRARVEGEKGVREGEGSGGDGGGVRSPARGRAESWAEEIGVGGYCSGAGGDDVAEGFARGVRWLGWKRSVIVALGKERETKERARDKPQRSSF